MSRLERLFITLVCLMGVFAMLHFLLWWFQPQHVSQPVLYALLSFTFVFIMARIAGYWWVFVHIQPYQAVEPPPGLTVDAMTTAAPGEPIEMTQTSLLALKAMTYPHETYLLDDSNNRLLKDFCEANGIHYLTRPDRVDAKCGNVNYGLRNSAGDFVLIIDPDHVVQPDYLDHVLGHFNNPKVGFVQTAQAYYNQPRSFVAKGGAEQTYMFYGPTMRGLNGLNANPVIGTNCTFRRAALDSIGLYKPGLAEDLHTSMALHSLGWESAYVPKILARGLTPEDLPSFCHQQLKWSRGVLELLVNAFPKYQAGMGLRQRLAYLLSMSYYFESIVLLINLVLPLICIWMGVLPADMSARDFLFHLAPWLAVSGFFFVYVQRWLCAPEERGSMWRGMVLYFITVPFHLLGILYAIVGRTIPYLPTAKVSSNSVPVSLLAPQLLILALSAMGGCYVYFAQQDAMLNGMGFFSLWNAAVLLTGIVCCVPMHPHYFSRHKLFVRVCNQAAIEAFRVYRAIHHKPALVKLILVAAYLRKFTLN